MALALLRGVLAKGVGAAVRELYQTGYARTGVCVGKDAFGNSYYEDHTDLYGV